MAFVLSGPSLGIKTLGPESGFLVIESLHTTGIAPLGVVFRAKWLGDDDGHSTADFVWSFDDEGATWDVFDSDNCPMPNNRNASYGPIATHTFREPGTYVVSCTSRRADGETKTATRTVTVADPDEEDWTKDVYVSFDNDFSGVPSAGSVVKHISTREALASEIGTSAFARVRLRFRRGETFDVLEIKPQEHRLFWVGAFGDGAKPKLIQSREGSASSNIFWVVDTDNVSVSGIEFDGGYDPVAGEFDTDFTRATFMRATDSGLRLTVTGVKVSGMVRAFYTRGALNVFDDCEISDWQDYGAFSTPRELGVSGGTWKQDAAATSYDGKDPEDPDVNDPDHGPIRTFVRPAGRVRLDSVSMRAKGGWSSSGGASDGERSTQPCVRLLFESSATNIFTDTRICVMHSAFSGGRETIVFGLQRASDPFETVGKGLIDGNVFNLDSWAWAPVAVRSGGTTIQNNLIVMPDVSFSPASGASHLRGICVMQSRGSGTTEAVYSAPGLVRNNTFINLQSSENTTHDLLALYDQDTESLSNLTERDNLLVGANVPNAGSLPDWSPLDANYAPDTGSAAIEGATGPAPYRDLLGNIRPANASVGALEPDD